MGVVYKAVDPNLDRRVAIKVVRPEQLDDGARRRLLREARALAKISHPNVVTVHDVGEHEQQVFVATEFVDGETMAIWQVGRDWRALIEAWIQVARGLSAAHAGGIVHRDVKPSNVFVGRDGRVRIGDFGIARSREGDSSESSTGRVTSLVGTTVTSAVAGTPGYMAPEQFRGEVDARSDQFALCVAIIEGLTGRRPDAGTVPPMPETPALLRDALIRGLAVDPSARFATIAELADALAATLQIPASPAPRSRSRIRTLILFAGAATTAVIAALIATRLESHSDPAASEGNASSQRASTSVIGPSHEGVAVAESAPGKKLVPPPNVGVAPGKELARSTKADVIVTPKATPDSATGLFDERLPEDKPHRPPLRRTTAGRDTSMSATPKAAPSPANDASVASTVANGAAPPVPAALDLFRTRYEARGASDGSERAAPQSAVPAKPARRTMSPGRVLRPGIDCMTTGNQLASPRGLPPCPLEIPHD